MSIQVFSIEVNDCLRGGTITNTHLLRVAIAFCYLFCIQPERCAFTSIDTTYNKRRRCNRRYESWKKQHPFMFRRSKHIRPPANCDPEHGEYLLFIVSLVETMARFASSIDLLVAATHMRLFMLIKKRREMWNFPVVCIKYANLIYSH
jgi:hypothetical protein